MAALIHEQDPERPYVVTATSRRAGFLKSERWLRICAPFGERLAELREADWLARVDTSPAVYLGRTHDQISGTQDHWFYDDTFWTADEFALDLTERDLVVAAEVARKWTIDRQRRWEDRQAEDRLIDQVNHQVAEERRQAKLAWAKARLEGAPRTSARSPIPRETRFTVWERDGGACVECGASFDLQYDHIIPVSMGGATSVENLQLLCGPCNRQKGPTLG